MCQGNDEIFRLGCSFLEVEEDIVSLRYNAANEIVTATTAPGDTVNVGKSSQIETYKIPDLIARIQCSVRKCSSDARKLLGCGLLWLLADVYGLPEIWEDMLHEDAEMFGCKGKANVSAFKKEFLDNNTTNNYRVSAVHQVDTWNRVIVSDFECLIKGKEGRGTEVMKYDENWKVIRVNAIRH